MAQIDSLQIEINADTKNAIKSLQTLTKNLTSLSTTLGRLNTNSNGFNVLANGINSIGDAMKNYKSSAVKTSDFSRLATQLDKLASVNAWGLVGVSNAVTHLVSVSQQIKALGDAPQYLFNFANALCKLGSANISKAITNLSQMSTQLSGQFQNVNFTNLANSITNLTTAMQGYSASGVKTVDFSRLATQLGKITTIDPSSLGILASGIRQIGISMSLLPVMGDASKSVVELANAFSRLGSANISKAISNLQSINPANISVLASQLSRLSSAISQMQGFNDMTTRIVEFANSLAKLGGKSIERAITNMPRLAKEIKNLITQLSTAPKVSKNVTSLLTAVGNLNGKMVNLSGGTTKATKSLDLFHKSASKSQSASKGLASTIGKIYATYWMLFRAFSMLSKAVNYASSLTEVQNVVEQTFGQSTKRVDEFAKASKESLGMSELTAKEIASRYQAMGGAMNLASDTLGQVNDRLKETTNGYIEAGNSASSMSLTLTKLAGDMASFYDKDQKEVAEDLEAIYTGMTRPLRKYGIDLTQATLQEYANAKGIDKKVSAMSQAEKTVLRYEMVLERTSSAQGDFLRTADTWANQVKLMKQNFISLGTTIGQVFINAFKPWLRTLNNVLVAVNEFAIKVANALGNIFGWTYEGNDVGLLSEFEEDADSLADDFSNANSEAKKLKNTIMGYDELNVMQSPNDSSSGSGSGTGSIGGTGLDDGSNGMGHWIKKYESDIDNLFDLGKKISDAITKTFQSIDWNGIYKKVGDGFKGLADFLNGLITPEMFAETGKFLASALNTAFHGLYEFAKTFNWENLGESISAGINGFFERANFDSWVETLKTWVNGICTTIQTVIDDTNWSQIAVKIATAINNLFDADTFSNVAKTIAEMLNTAVKTLFETSQEVDWEGIGSAIASAINTFFETFDFEQCADMINSFASGLYDAVKKAIEDVDWSNVWEGVRKFFTHLNVKTLKVAFGALLFMYGKKQLTQGGISSLIKSAIGVIAGKLGVTVPKLNLYIAVATVTFIAGQKIGRELGKLLADEASKSYYENFHWFGEGGFFDEVTKDGETTVTALQEMFSWDNIFKDLKDGDLTAYFRTPFTVLATFNPFAQWVMLLQAGKEKVQEIKDKINEKNNNNLSEPIENATKSAQNVKVELDKAYGSATTLKGQFGSISLEAESSKNKVNELGNSYKTAFGSAKTSIDDFNSSVGGKLGTTFDKAKESINSWSDDAKNKTSSVKSSFETFTQNVGGKLSTTYDSAKSSIKDWADDTEAKRNDTRAKFKDWTESVKDNMSKSFDDIANTMGKWWTNEAMPLFDARKWKDQTDHIAHALMDSIKKAFSEFSSEANNWFRGVVEPLFSSQKWTFSGIADGIKKAFENAFESVKGIWNKFADSINEKLSFEWGAFDIGDNHFSGGSISLGKIPKFAKGGFPEDGLFMANHGELVGKFSNGRTAVANNEQITEGIKKAVIDGMMQVVMATSGNNEQQGDINLYLDGRVIAQTTYNNLKTMGRQGLIPQFI